MQDQNTKIPGSQMPGHSMTAFYCELHDLGCLVLEHHDTHADPPAWLSTTCANSESMECVWKNHGHIQPDGTNDLPSQDIYDSRHGGGWRVSFYADVEVYDIHGNLVWESIRGPATEICIALQDLDLPALVTLEIIDELFPNVIRMWPKWEMITAVKHFHQRQHKK